MGPVISDGVTYTFDRTMLCILKRKEQVSAVRQRNVLNGDSLLIDIASIGGSVTSFTAFSPVCMRMLRNATLRNP